MPLYLNIVLIITFSFMLSIIIANYLCKFCHMRIMCKSISIDTQNAIH